MDLKTKEDLLNAETAVIGSILVDPACLGDVMLQVQPIHFVHPEYRRIFEGIARLWQDKEPVDAVTVLHEIGDQYKNLLMEIMEVTPTAANVLYYAKILHEQSRLYQMHSLALQLASTDSLEAASKLSDKIFSLTSDRQDIRVVSWRQGVEEFWRRQMDPAPKYLPWGLAPLDSRLKSEAGDYIILGGTPSSGKTAFALQLAKGMAEKGYRVGFFSLETKDSKLIDRIVAQRANISMQRIKEHRLNENDWNVMQAIAKSRNDPLDVIRCSGVTVSDIQSITMTHHYDVIFVDYVQLITGEGYNRAEEVAGISRALHTMCQRINVTTIALSQLRRPDQGDKIAKKRTAQMSDLKESSQLEADADFILMLNARDEQQRLLQVVKNKDGPLGEVDLSFDPDHLRFSVFAEPDEDEETNSRGFAKPKAPPLKEVV